MNPTVGFGERMEAESSNLELLIRISKLGLLSIAVNTFLSGGSIQYYTSIR